MAEITTGEIRDFLDKIQGQEISLSDLRAEFHILPETKSFDGVRNIMHQLAKQNIVKPVGRRQGIFKVVKEVKPVPLFSIVREKIPPFPLIFPRYDDTDIEMDFSEYIVVREGDLITLAGRKNKSKTLMCINFAAVNVDKRPILMGNEYTKLVNDIYVPDQRFLNRLQNIDNVEWVDEDGNDKVTLLPVKGDYAEHIVPNRLNIIDWINLDANQLYDISKVMEDIKSNLGRGVAIVALQKGKGAEDGRGGQFTKDFTDCELLLDGWDGNDDALLTIGTVKEKTKPIMGKTYIFSNWNGAKITNFREVVKCHTCWGKGWKKVGNGSAPCDNCGKTGYVDL